MILIGEQLREMLSDNAVFQMGHLHELLSGYEEELAAVEACKDAVGTVNRQIAVLVRKASALMQSVHHCPDQSEIASICNQAKESLAPLPDLWKEVHDKLDGRHAELFKFIWRHNLTQLVSIAAFIHYLTSGKLLSKAEAEEMLGVASSPFAFIDLEDYLLGATNLSNDLSRFCTNLVTAGDLKSPPLIASFVSELYSAFGTLNLRNDLLRKKFDGIKYDLQKIESIVYDLAIRKLTPPTS